MDKCYKLGFIRISVYIYYFINLDIIILHLESDMIKN